MYIIKRILSCSLFLFTVSCHGLSKDKPDELRDFMNSVIRDFIPDSNKVIVAEPLYKTIFDYDRFLEKETFKDCKLKNTNEVLSSFKGVNYVYPDSTKLTVSSCIPMINNIVQTGSLTLINQIWLENFEDVPVKKVVILSLPIFSNDGKYAMIMVRAGYYSRGTSGATYLYEKKDGKWLKLCAFNFVST